MSILSIDLHSSKSTIILPFHFQNVTYESVDHIYCSTFSTGCNPTCLDDGLNPASHPHGCTLDLFTIQGNITGGQYTRDVLQPVVVPHFDNDPQATVSPSPHPAIGYTKLSSDQWILRHVLKYQPRRAKHHAKRNRWFRSTNSGRLMTLIDLSPADFRRFPEWLSLYCSQPTGEKTHTSQQCERFAKIR
jgi:hypothetical protein